jgi:hypothetical protein
MLRLLATTVGDASASSDFEIDEAPKRKKQKGLYKVKNAEIRSPAYSSLPAFQSPRRHMRTASTSACERPQRVQSFVFSVDSERATFEPLAMGDGQWQPALEAKLANALLTTVKGNLVRRLAVMTARLAISRHLFSSWQVFVFVQRICEGISSNEVPVVSAS